MMGGKFLFCSQRQPMRDTLGDIWSPETLSCNETQETKSPDSAANTTSSCGDSGFSKKHSAVFFTVTIYSVISKPFSFPSDLPEFEPFLTGITFTAIRMRHTWKLLELCAFHVMWASFKWTAIIDEMLCGKSWWWTKFELVINNLAPSANTKLTIKLQQR